MSLGIDFKDTDEYLIRVIGEDNKQHVAYPWEDKCKCGMAIKRKKPRPNNWQLFSCYECTY